MATRLPNGSTIAFGTTDCKCECVDKPDPGPDPDPDPGGPCVACRTPYQDGECPMPSTVFLVLRRYRLPNPGTLIDTTTIPLQCGSDTSFIAWTVRVPFTNPPFPGAAYILSLANQPTTAAVCGFSLIRTGTDIISYRFLRTGIPAVDVIITNVAFTDTHPLGGIFAGLHTCGDIFPLPALASQRLVFRGDFEYADQYVTVEVVD